MGLCRSGKGDRVPREIVRWALRKAGMEERLVKTVMAMYEGMTTRIWCDGGCSEWFELNVGVHQGSVLSPLFFIIVLEVVSKEPRVGLSWELLYADDLALTTESENELKAGFKNGRVLWKKRPQNKYDRDKDHGLWCKSSA